MKNRRPVLHDESGQSVTEYMLLVVMLISFFFVMYQALEQLGISEMMTAPIREDFARAYRYGHPEAKGFEEGTPENHPRITPATGGNTNFRIFINPVAN